MKGVALHCGRHGCVVKLADGRFGNLAASEPGYTLVRRSLSAQRRPEFDFIVHDDERWPRLHLAQSDAPEPVAARSLNAPVAANAAHAPASLDEKIIDYLRQTADWDPTGALASRAIEQKKSRAQRMTLASELRARRRAGPAKRPNSKKH